MRDCESCAHAKVCQYQYTRKTLEDAVRDLADQEGFSWPLTLALTCQQYERADKYTTGQSPYVEAPDWFKQGPTCSGFAQDEPSDLAMTLKGGGEDGE